MLLNIAIFLNALSISEGALSWILVILGIGFLIFIHELGHFLVAKYEGVRVEAFALGFGKSIFSFHWRGTEYRINFIPLGGYVKMAGEMPGERLSGRGDEFMSKRPAQRARILVAGVAMNALFGVVGTILAFQIGIRFIVPTVGLVQEGSPAWKAGLQEGDKILQVDQEKISSFTDLFVAIAFSEGEQGVTVKAQRNGTEFTTQVHPEYNPNRGIPTMGVAPPLLAEVKASPGSNAYQAGLRTGDIITKIEGKPVKDGYDIERTLATIESEQITLSVRRDDKEITIEWKPPHRQTTYRIGIIARQVEILAIQQQTLQQGKMVPTQASQSKLRLGDVIHAVNGQEIHSKKALRKTLQDLSGPITLSVLREGKKLEISLDFASYDQFVEHLAFRPDLYVGEVLPDYPASEHLQAGDKIIAANGNKLEDFSDIYNVVQKNQNQEILFTFLRDGKKMQAKIAPKKVAMPVWGSLALTRALTPAESYSFVEACERGWNHTKNMVMQIFLMLKGLASQQISSKTLGGPVTIFAASHSYLQLGLGRFIYFLALISINLAVVNLLPIPILDGGHLVFLGIESIKGSPVSEEAMIWANYIGFLFLLFLIIYVTTNDIERVFFG